MAKLPCLLCNSVSWEKEFEIQDIFDEQYTFGYCSSCQVFSLNPFPTSRQLTQAYDESYYGVGEKKFNPLVERVVDWFRARNAANFSKGISESGCVLDIGCGNGSFLNALSQKGNFELHGIEPPGKSGDRAEEFRQIELHRGYLEEATYPPNKFDAIVLTHVFEHLPKPFETLQIIRKIARQNALLQIEIPNINSWQYNVFKSKWLHLDPPRHLNMFPPQVLIAHLEKGGWKLVDEQQSILNMVCKQREVLYEHLKNNTEYTNSYSGFSILLQKLFHWLSFPLFVGTDLLASTAKKGGTVKLKFRKL